MQVDHIESVFKVEYKAGYDITKIKVEELNANDNLLPSCRQCNFYKGAGSLERFRKNLANMLMNNLRKTFQFKLAVKHGLVTDNHIEKVKFYFEKNKMFGGGRMKMTKQSKKIIKRLLENEQLLCSIAMEKEQDTIWKEKMIADEKACRQALFELNEVAEVEE